MTRSWQLQEAKSKFSELINQVEHEGPQLITKRGTETAVVISYSEYRQLLALQEPLSMFFRNSPMAGADIDLERDHGMARDVDIL